MILGAAVAAFSSVGYVLMHSKVVPDAGQTPGYTAPPLPASSSPRAAESSSKVPNVRVAFLGDDYTLGRGASSKAHRFTTLVSDELGVLETNVASNGAGYAKASPSGKIYGDLVSAVVAAKPDVVVVSGGRNDVYDSTATLGDAAHTLFTTLRRRLPRATLVALRPFWGDSVHPSDLTPVDEAVRSAVKAAGGTFLDVGDPLRGHRRWMADLADPNDRGYRALAGALAPRLKAALHR